MEQSRELAIRLSAVEPPIERVYSSPYYRCLQTLQPYVSRRQERIQGEELPTGRIDANAGGAERQGSAAAATVCNGLNANDSNGAAGRPSLQILCESGLGEWYGSAPFEHPTSAPPETLRRLFPSLLDPEYKPVVVPTRMGESIDELHDRVAATLEDIITQCDRDGTRTVLLCTHAAVVIALGRVLTGVMPAEIDAEDFRAFTCGLSIYRRKKRVSAASEARSGQQQDGGVRPTRQVSGAGEIGTQSSVDPRDDRQNIPAGDGQAELDGISSRRHTKAGWPPKAPVWRRWLWSIRRMAVRAG